MNAEVFTLDELDSLKYSTLLELAKKYNVYQKREKKKLVIKRLVGLRKEQEELEEVDENSDPAVAFEENRKRPSTVKKKKDELKVIKSSTKCIEDKMATRKSTIVDSSDQIEEFKNIIPLLPPVKDSEEEENSRRSTFCISSQDQVEEFKNSVALILPVNDKEEVENSRRSTFSIPSPEDLPRGNVPTNAQHPDLRRLTFVRSGNTPIKGNISVTRGSDLTAVESPLQAKSTKIEKQQEVTLCQLTRSGRTLLRGNIAMTATKTPKVKSPKLLRKSSSKASLFSTKTVEKGLSLALNTPGTEKKSGITASGRKLGTLPNFRAIHEKQFARMESLMENKTRTAKRALQLFSPKPQKKTSAIPVAVRESKIPVKENRENLPKIPDLKSKRSAIPVMSRREGMKTIASKIPAASMEKTREKGRATIAGVRSNRRFELQMKMRNLTTVS